MSTKSQRPKAPGEKPASDGLPEITKGGTHPEQHNPAGSGKPSVPAMDRSTSGRHQGNVEAESAVSVGAPAPHQGGGPGFAKDKGDAGRKGGTVHQT
jgi:hypothetical protein